MRPYLLVAWLLIPVGAGAYHFGPGQQQSQLDDAAAMFAEADRLAAAHEWQEAISWYDKGLAILPAEQQSRSWRARLEKAKALLASGGLPTAFEQLEVLNDELATSGASPAAASQSTHDANPTESVQAKATVGQMPADPALVSEAQEALANAQYYVTWSLRLEGQPREVWEPIVESSRQTYRLLAERASQEGRQDQAQRHGADVEAAIRLARMDLEDLQGLPLPSQ